MGNGMSFWGVLVIMVIVAAVASLITVSVTGNTIKDKEDSATDTYTKEEINSMMDELSESLTKEEDSEALVCDPEGICELNELSVEGEFNLASISAKSSPFRTDNVYVCVDKQGKLYRGTSSGCR